MKKTRTLLSKTSGQNINLFFKPATYTSFFSVSTWSRRISSMLPYMRVSSSLFAPPPSIAFTLLTSGLVTAEFYY